MSKTEIRKCSLCGATLRTDNKEKTCSSHNFPYYWDPIGDEIRRKNKLLMETGVLLEINPICKVIPPLVSTLQLRKTTHEGIVYEFLTSEI